MSEIINKDPILPIRQIGEDNWIENLTSFLENHDVEVISLKGEKIFQKTEQHLDWIIPS
ncbi:hypothetical protein FJQ98_11465 [Lysinibacillus agricola]|uniref:Uncharacterized protein n=1 Tax=Lysinibacillus agricola TaxID=2590012 RepID=A0ABX7AX62_9BACI|nr:MULTISPECIES: hypothetical protein [Lysinibacillus]QQP14565.1 hypothetical protein FJQ98_11465 [Lysinibacillus agricola]